MVGAVAACVLSACAGGDAKGVTGAANSSFAQLQVQVLDKSCATAGCHVAGSRNTPLVLTGGDVHARLVGAAPANAAARADGLLLVDPGNPARSLLWHKLTVVPGHHAASYGGAMPLGQDALSVEQVEFVRQWIERGAPRDGAVVPAALLAGTTPQSTTAYTALTPPPTGSGFQLKVAPFPVSPKFEREFFTYQRVGNTDTAYVTRMELQMRNGSHHLIAYDFAPDLPGGLRPAEGTLRDIRNPDGSQNLLNMIAMPWHVFLVGAQTPRSTYEFPAGVALRLPPNARLDLNSHYVNAGTKEIVGEAEVNLHTVPRSQVTKVAEALFLSNQQITIPQGRDTTITTTFRMTKATQVLMLSSHMHKRGIRFRIRWVGGARDGELLYDSDTWEHPAIVNFPTPLELAAGEGLRSEVTYRGDPGRVVRFGLTSEDEMGIIFGYAVAP